MKILIADDHALFREGLHYTLKALDNDVEILEAANGSQAIQIVRHYPDLDLVLMDLDMPGLDGYQGLTQLRQNYPELPVVIVTASEYEQDMIAIAHHMIDIMQHHHNTSTVLRLLPQQAQQMLLMAQIQMIGGFIQQQ